MDIKDFDHYLDLLCETLNEERHQYPNESEIRSSIEGQLHCAYRLRQVYRKMKREGKA